MRLLSEASYPSGRILGPRDKNKIANCDRQLATTGRKGKLDAKQPICNHIITGQDAMV